MPENLDDLSSIRALDPIGMFRLTEGFPDQYRHSLAEFHKPNVAGSGFTSVIVTGLGGSAISGDYLRALFDEYASIPLQVYRDYSLPKWIGPSTLVICVSYSGNTEETLSAYKDAKGKGASIVVVSSGGTITESASQDGSPVLPIPGGMPPRAALGHIFTTLVALCESLELLPSLLTPQIGDFLDSLCSRWATSSPTGGNDAKQLAASLQGCVPVFYGLGGWQGAVATRWKCQIEENAKLFAFAGALPEMDHNSIEPWASDPSRSNYSYVLLEAGNEIDRMRHRAAVTLGIVSGNAPFFRVRAKGESLLQRLLSLTLFGDFVSLYLAALNDTNPGEIKTLEQVKRELANS